MNPKGTRDRLPAAGRNYNGDFLFCHSNRRALCRLCPVPVRIKGTGKRRRDELDQELRQREYIRKHIYERHTEKNLGFSLFEKKNNLGNNFHIEMTCKFNDNVFE